MAPLPKTVHSLPLHSESISVMWPLLASRVSSCTTFAFSLCLKPHSVLTQSFTHMVLSAWNSLRPTIPTAALSQHPSQFKGLLVRDACPEFLWSVLLSISALCLEPNRLWVQILALPLSCYVALFLIFTICKIGIIEVT